MCVDIHGSAAKESNRRHTELVRKLDSQTGRRRNRSDNWDAGDHCLLRNLEAEPSTDHQNHLRQRQRLSKRSAQNLIHRIMSPNVLAQQNQAALRIEKPDRMDPARAIEVGLSLPELRRKRAQHVVTDLNVG